VRYQAGAVLNKKSPDNLPENLQKLNVLLIHTNAKGNGLGLGDCYQLNPARPVSLCPLSR
jgi:hypothetical protein